MINIQHIRKVFLIGIGGMGMSALARYFKEKGCEVAGYDRSSSLLTRQLEEDGVAVFYDDEITKELKDAELTIYTPAIPSDNVIYNYALNEKRTLLKRSEVLQLILRDMDCIAVAGTHGKTTISSMIAHILRDSGFGCNAFLGGITANYATNYWADEHPLAVVEADEYDRSFLRLSPNAAVLTAMDPDHLDIYGTADNMRQAFVEFTNKIKDGGLLVYKKQLENNGDFGGDRKCSYDLKDNSAAVFAKNIQITDGNYWFDVVIGQTVIENIKLSLGGIYNVENALAAVAVCIDAGVDPEAIRNALATFRGVKRRFEYVIREEDCVYIDDYAHHPEELKMLLSGVRELYPDEGFTVIFQPHLYSRTKDLAAEFAKALDLADKVILLPVYPAREKPIPGVSSSLIADLMDESKARVCEKEVVEELLLSDQNKIIVTAGAGDIGMMIEKIKKCLENKENVS